MTNHSETLKNMSTLRTALSIPANQFKAARLLSFLLAGIWFVFGGIYLIRRLYTVPDLPGWLWIVGLLMFGNAASFVLAGFGLGTGRRMYFYFTLLLLAANILLTFTDEFGVFDFLTLFLLLIMLVLLLWSRGSYN